MEDRSLRLDFHEALDPVATPAPWLSDRVRRDLRRRIPAAQPARKRGRGRFVFRPTARRALALVLTVLVVVAALGASLVLYRYLHAPIQIRPVPGAATRACGQGGVYMIDPNVGWNGTQRTSDGGKTWHDASPPSPANSVKGGGTVCDLDAAHAWVVTGTGTDSYQPTQLLIQSTADGGQTWQQSAVIPIGYPVAWQVHFSVEMDFFDVEHGWLLTEYATSPMVRHLYATSDGGHTWSAVTTAPGLGLGDMARGCSENGMMFVSLARGWLTWNCGSGYGDQSPSGTSVIAVTGDGGHRWTPLQLESFPAGDSCAATTPVFTHSKGMLEVTCSGTGQAGDAKLYSTADAGQSWTARLLPVWSGADIVNGTTAFYFRDDGKSSTLFRTADGGASWAAVASGLFPGDAVSGSLFIDATTGYADVSNSPVPYWTFDGGKTWSLPGVYRTVGSTVCAQPEDRGAGRPAGVKMISTTTGWAAGARRTTDGGATWNPVGPPPLKSSGTGYGEFFLDATHAWVAQAVGSSTACADGFVVFSTSDGGAHWRQGKQTTIKLDTHYTLSGNWSMSVDFVDPNHGWVLVRPLAFGYAPAGPLYRTADGGGTWALVTTQIAPATGSCSPGGADLVFSSATTGWIGARCGDNVPWPLAYLVTHDGGGTWAVQTLAPSIPSSPPSPRFFDASNGWLLEPYTPLLMMTADGGGTWAQHGLPQLPGYACTGKHGENMTCTDQGFAAVAFLDPNHGWALITQFPLAKGGVPDVARFERTVDGGKTWGPVSSNLLGSTADMSQATMTLVDQNDGFLWTGTALYRTADGGQTWNPVKITYR